MSQLFFLPADADLLEKLLRIPTVSPLEIGVPGELRRAQELYAANAAEVGFTVVSHEPPPPEALEVPFVPSPVREAAARLGPDFLAAQPNLVLRLGPPRPPARTLMFNFHMDTVAGDVSVHREKGRFTGRGAADMKGPGGALLAGVRGALARRPGLAGRWSVVLQCVGGEEGGAMGVYGTRVLVERGHVGLLNVFAEPSDGAYFDRATTSMTACVEMEGHGSTDDEPQAGHNATLLLGYLAQYLGRSLAGPVEAAYGKLCVAGLHTGDMHNRVYGSGKLLLNLAYPTVAAGDDFRRCVEASFSEGLRSFRRNFAGIPLVRRTTEEAADVCRLIWLKCGLPVLDNRAAAVEAVLARVGWERDPDPFAGRAFTCDAFWAQGPGLYTVVFGPGGLGRNGAHTSDEFIEEAELDTYAGRITDLLTAFYDDPPRKEEKG